MPGSIRRAFEARGWEVVSVDLDPGFEPTVCCDVMELKEAELGRFDMVWASPVCTEYWRAMCRRPRRLEEGDPLVRRTLEIIANVRPRWWAFQNPHMGLLKTRPLVQGLPYSDVCYCKYGYRYKKETRIWLRCLRGPQAPRIGAEGEQQRQEQRPVPAPAVQHAPAALRRDRGRRQHSIKRPCASSATRHSG